jgi:polyhydroxybutyrate depolymerase
MVGHVLERIAARENLVVVYPDGYEGHFNDCRRVASYSARTLDIDDVGFSARIVERLAAERKIDPASTYALGFSNGAHMVLRLAIEAPRLAKGAVVIAANTPTRENFACTTAASPSRRIVFVAGTRDPINPYQGGQVTLFGFRSRGTVNSAEDSAKWFADALGLKVARPVTTVRNAGLEVRQQDWESPDAHVRLVTIEGGGHTIPQANYRFPRIFGATLRSDSVLESSLRVLLGAE